MRILHLAIAIFIQILLTSSILYTSVTLGSPVNVQQIEKKHNVDVSAYPESPVIVDSALFKQQTRMVSARAATHQQPAPQVSEPDKMTKTQLISPVMAPKSSPVNQVEAIKPEEAPKAKEIIAIEARKVDAPVASVAKEQQTPVMKQVITNAVQPPVVMGGQGPLHLLAATLCSYQPDKPTENEQINSLYTQRAAIRKSLFDFMSLKFTNLEKLSSRLNSGLEVVPPKPVGSSASSKVPTHGWPVVGKCTAHDLKLMAEAAWCECTDAGCEIAKSRAKLPEDEPKQLKRQKRSIEDFSSLLPMDPSSPNSPAIIPKLVDSIINSQASRADSAIPIEASLASLNLTQQQLSVIQAQAGLTHMCKKNALRLSKALFNHLAEDQSDVSESWPKLYNLLTEDDCARKRMVDIVTALSDFRSESTSVRRDNVEFAFAVDDLRAKVLENDINAPLTFDKQFIEVEQFLQQSVKLMLANIDPERAKLTSMRYRSLMSAPVSSDDQCVQLHQLLLAKSHPTDCNPNQYGQLPDVLRMTAHSLALWSIENELSRLVFTKSPEYNPIAPLDQKLDMNSCIANLVRS